MPFFAESSMMHWRNYLKNELSFYTCVIQRLKGFWGFGEQYVTEPRITIALYWRNDYICVTILHFLTLDMN
jgi:hypothetical protein